MLRRLAADKQYYDHSQVRSPGQGEEEAEDVQVFLSFVRLFGGFQSKLERSSVAA